MSGQDLKNIQKRRSQKGQIAVEFILLVGVSVVIAVTIVTLMVSRDSEEPGFLIRVWDNIVKEIGSDHPGKM